MTETDEHVRRALAAVEKMEKFHLWKLLALRGVAVGAAAWFVMRTAQTSAVAIECTVIIMVGLIAAICTAKIQYQMDKNTRAILLALSRGPGETGWPPQI